MAITGATIVQDAMYQAGILGVGESPSDADAQFVLRRLNRLMDSWSTERQMVYSLDVEQFTMTAGTAVYTTASFPDGRPVSIDSIYVRLSNIDYPVQMIDNQSWDDIPYKLTTGIPSVCWVNPSYPDMTLSFYPVPYASFTCFADSNYVLPDTIDLTTSVALPPGYEKAIVDNLAVDICPSFGIQATDQMRADAIESKGNMKRANYSPLLMDTGIDNKGVPPDAFTYRGF